MSLGVIRHKQGNLITARVNSNHESDDFLPCAFCKSWILRSFFKLHEKRGCNFADIVMHRDDFPQNLSFLALSKKVFYAEMDKIGARHNVTKAKKSFPHLIIKCLEVNLDSTEIC